MDRMGPFGFREVIPDQSLPEKWRDFTLNAGGTQSTLQDIKVPERAGGYAYKDNTKSTTRNRFIYWRICQDVVELVEQSLDYNLTSNCIRYKFQDAPVLEGLSIHESHNHVVVLVTTVSSVHRFDFPHPDKFNRQDFYFEDHPGPTTASIFTEASLAAAKDPRTFHVINNQVISNQLPHTATSWLSSDGKDAMFALAYQGGSILLVRLNINGVANSVRLRQDSIVPRFLSGLAGAIRGKAQEISDQSAAGMALLEPNSVVDDWLLLSLCRDGQLRIWSCTKQQCLSVTDVLSSNGSGPNVSSSANSLTLTQGAHSHLLRKVVDRKDGLVLFVVYMCFADESRFYILNLTNKGTLIRWATIYAPKGQDLVEFAASNSTLWAVWGSPDGEPCVSYTSFAPENTRLWRKAELDSGPERNSLTVDPGSDPKSQYLAYIFYPGRFSLAVINKALHIYRRSPITSSLDPSLVSCSEALRERVAEAVEDEVRADLNNYDIADDEYLEVAHRFWDKFYSCCAQYHLADCRSLGLVIMPAGCGGFIVKKRQVSLLRPMDALEHLILSPSDQINPKHISQSSGFAENPDTCSDIIKLFGVLSEINNHLPSHAVEVFEKDLARLTPSEVAAKNLIDQLLLTHQIDNHFLYSIRTLLNRLSNISEAIRLICTNLFLSPFQPNDSTPMEEELDNINTTNSSVLMHTNSTKVSKAVLTVGQIFASQMGSSIVATTLRHFVQIRLVICRNLLLLQQLLMRESSLSWNLPPSQMSDITTTLLSQTSLLTQAYWSVWNICQVPALAPRRPSDRAMTLLEMFMRQGGGLMQARELLARCYYDSNQLANWNYALTRYSLLVCLIIWPISSEFLFGEFLHEACLHQHVLSYVRILQWCENNSRARCFIAGCAWLACGDAHKATDLFLKGGKNVHLDDWLSLRLITNKQQLTSKKSPTPEEIVFFYYLEIIELLDSRGRSDCILRVAQSARCRISSTQEANLATLLSIEFQHHLSLGHDDEAYSAMVFNPDHARRKDCLRQLISELLSKGRSRKLATFPYVDLLEEVERILETRARALDPHQPLEKTTAYDFLYAFHIRRNNFRKAATIMFEQALRLSQEPSTIESLRRQELNLLTCINCLLLGKKEYAWVVKPGTHVHVLKVPDLRRELILVQARLEVVSATRRQQNEEMSDSMSAPAPHLDLTAPELVVLLSEMGRFKFALRLCRSYSLSKETVFQALTTRCVSLSEQTDLDSRDSCAWEWIAANDSDQLGKRNAADAAWKLLQKYLEQEEKPPQTILHRAITQQLICLNQFLPHWLLASYKRQGPAELLRLLVHSGRLEEATTLALEFVWAVMGQGKEHFGTIVNVLDSTKVATTWLPHNIIRLLLGELQIIQEPDYLEMFEELKNLYQLYLETALRVSEEKEIKMRM